MTIHPFEKSGLGKAPFRCVGIRENWYSACAGHRQPGGHCNYCGTGIAYEFIIKDCEDRQFIVGSDCVTRTHAQVEDFAKIKKTHEKEKRHARAEVLRAARKANRDAAFAIARQERYDEFKAAHPETVAMLESLCLDTADEFTRDMAANLAKWGRLTDNQLAALKAKIEREGQREKDRELSEHVATIGKRVEGSFRIVAVVEIGSAPVYPFAPIWLNVLRMNDKDICTYKGKWLGERGESFRAKFTVKEHGEYKGTKQTKLQRPALLEEK